MLGSWTIAGYTGPWWAWLLIEALVLAFTVIVAGPLWEMTREAWEGRYAEAEEAGLRAVRGEDLVPFPVPGAGVPELAESSPDLLASGPAEWTEQDLAALRATQSPWPPPEGDYPQEWPPPAQIDSWLDSQPLWQTPWIREAA